MKFVKEAVRIGWNDIDARFDIQKINLRLREVYGPNRAHLKISFVRFDDLVIHEGTIMSIVVFIDTLLI